MRRLWWAALPLLLAVACDPGSKTVGIEYYKLDFTVTQGAGGIVVIQGTTDLPVNTAMDAVLTLSPKAAGAQDQAVLVGSTGTPGSFAPRITTGGKPSPFRIELSTVVTDTCHLQPPCGPFAAGTYYLLLDVHTPPDAVGGPSSLDDRRYTPTLHGFVGGAGLEVFKAVTLQPIKRFVNQDGVQSGEGVVASLPEIDATPAPTPSP